MLDTKKILRSIALYREDILKCERCAKVSLSGRVRDLLHADMSRYELDAEGKRMLKEGISVAVEARKAKFPNAGARSGKKSFACGYEEIPESVRKGAKFVKEGKKPSRKRKGN